MHIIRRVNLLHVFLWETQLRRNVLSPGVDKLLEVLVVPIRSPIVEAERGVVVLLASALAVTQVVQVRQEFSLPPARVVIGQCQSADCDVDKVHHAVKACDGRFFLLQLMPDLVLIFAIGTSQVKEHVDLDLCVR